MQFDKSIEGDKAIATEPAVGATLQSGDTVTLILSNAVKSAQCDGSKASAVPVPSCNSSVYE